MLLSRRRWLGAVAALFTTTSLRGGPLALLGCARREPAAPASVYRTPIAAIPDGGRIEIEHLTVHVELRREGERVHARSLLCSHQLCRVQWREEERRYHCPCHEGLFAEDGSVVYGPPTRPLRALTVHQDGDAVWIDVHEVFRVPAADTALAD